MILRRTEETGETVGRRRCTPAGRRRMPTVWLKAVRFHLYLFMFFPILLGASIGASSAKTFDFPGFILAALIGLLAHAAISFSNESADELIDRNNGNRTMFSGGIGLLANGCISQSELKLGWVVTSILAVLISAVLVFFIRYH